MLVALALILSLVCGVSAHDLASAMRQFQQAQTAYTNQPGNAVVAWQFGRACFDLVGAVTNKTQRAAVAEQGIAACRQALLSEPKSAPGHYYLALNLGELARTRGLSALKLVNEMEVELAAAVAADASFDHAGPERTLGMLYRDAPSIISVGNRGKARQHLRRAVELAPRHPENRLELIEGYLKWSDRDAARRELKALEEIWPAARAELSGPAWAGAWNAWEAQLQRIRKRLDEAPRLETPRH